MRTVDFKNISKEVLGYRIHFLITDGKNNKQNKLERRFALCK